MSGGPEPSPRAAASSSFTSAPATNVRPAQARTMAVTRASRAASATASASAFATDVLSAFTGGLSISMTAIRSWTEARTDGCTAVYSGAGRSPLHPKGTFGPFRITMSAEAALDRPPAFHDIAHLGHIELLTPKPDESLAFF